MKITRIQDLHADAGWRVFSFLKIETDAGIVGYSEYNESYGSKGLTAVIQKLAETLIGKDPRPVEKITATLYAMTRRSSPAVSFNRRLLRSKMLWSMSRRKRSAFPSPRCWAGRCATSSGSTGRTAAATG
ncbi:MAG: hypothetical protein R3D67_14250 [Hyphomicrobiaceae bacterium]